MKDLFFVFALLIGAFVTLQMRATKKPFDYKAELMADAAQEDSLASAMEKSLEKSKEVAPDLSESNVH
jgi:hypothetical protein